MPKQVIHEGRAIHLIPIRKSSTQTDPVKPEDDVIVGYEYRQGFASSATSDVIAEQQKDWINDTEPSAHIGWSKGNGEDQLGNPGDQGYVDLMVTVTRSWFDRLANTLDSNLSTIEFSVGPLSWRDLNVLAKVAKQARDDAFGKPE